jgi:hypothetical protein
MDIRTGAPLAIFSGAALIALAILFVFRWEIGATSNGTVLLDRWGGRISICAGIDKNTFEMTCGTEFIKSQAPQ